VVGVSKISEPERRRRLLTRSPFCIRRYIRRYISPFSILPIVLPIELRSEAPSEFPSGAPSDLPSEPPSGIPSHHRILFSRHTVEIRMREYKSFSLLLSLEQYLQPLT
jgi:hypothetical protein